LKKMESNTCCGKKRRLTQYVVTEALKERFGQQRTGTYQTEDYLFKFKMLKKRLWSQMRFYSGRMNLKSVLPVRTLNFQDLARRPVQIV
jgi:hypothetical protein